MYNQTTYNPRKHVPPPFALSESQLASNNANPFLSGFTRESYQQTLTVNFTGRQPFWLSPVVQRLNELLALPSNWNSYGAQRIDPDVAKTVLELLSALLNDETTLPSMVPTAGGGILSELHKGDEDLEIQVGSEFGIEVFYSSPDNEEEFQIDDESSVRRFIDIWSEYHS